MVLSDEIGADVGLGLHCRLTCEMFSGIHDASRHTIESHAEDTLSAESAGVIYNKKS